MAKNGNGARALSLAELVGAPPAELVELRERHTSVRERLAEVEATIDRLQAAQSDEVAAVRQAQAREAVISGADPLEVAADTTGEAAELRRARQRRRALVEAVEELQRRVEAIESRWFAEACERVAPLHSDSVAEVCRALIALGRAVLVERQVREGLRELGVVHADSHLRPMPPPGMADPGDPHGRIALYLQEAAAYGFIDRDLASPAWLRQPAPQRLAEGTVRAGADGIATYQGGRWIARPTAPAQAAWT